MSLDENQTYYDILDIKPDASPHEVREAYLKTKAAYNKDSLALYTLISPDEREQMIKRIEEAYDVLSSPERRKDYDGNHGMISEVEERPRHPTPSPASSRKVVSIDRVPPMESDPDADAMLIAPSTDFGDAAVAASESPAGSAFDAPIPPRGTPTPSRTEPVMIPEISGEIEWKGAFLRRVREAKKVSIEEMSSITKITRSYLFAIEEENFAKLPAAVYLRGFLVQISKTLKLPHDKVATAYMVRYYQARPDQAH